MKYKHFKNSKDGNNCVQACIQMLLYSFGLPVLPFDELDRLTGHIPGKYTWMTKAILWLSSRGFKIIHVEDLDYWLFADRGAAYLKTIYSKEVFEVQERMSNLKREQAYAKKLIKNDSIRIVYGRCSVSVIEGMLDSGYFAMVSVNTFRLYDSENGCSSHLVVVCDFKSGVSGEPKTVRICDPNRGFRDIPISVFEKAIDKDDGSATFFTI